MSDPSYASGVQSTITKLIETESVSSLFRALPAIWCKQIPYTITSLSTFEILSSSAYSYLAFAGVNEEQVRAVRLMITTVSALAAGILSSLASQPGDALLSRVNTKSYVSSEVSSNSLQIIADSWQELGMKGLFIGTKARLFHVSTIVVSQLLVYDIIKQICGIPASGSTH